MINQPQIRAYTEQKWGTVRFDIDNHTNMDWPTAWAYLRDKRGLRGHNIEEALKAAIYNKVKTDILNMDEETEEETG